MIRISRLRQTLINALRLGGIQRGVPRQSAESGYVMFAGLLLLLVTGMFLAMWNDILIDQNQRLKDKAVSERLAQVTRAVRDYVDAHHTKLDQAITAAGTDGIAIGVANGTAHGSFDTIKGAGFLPAGFSETNAFGQREYVVIRQPGKWLHVMIFTYGGQSMPVDDLTETATRVGSMGGFIADEGPYNPGSIYGVNAGWKSDLDDWDNASAQPVADDPGPGHLAVTLGFHEGDVIKDYLYRVNVPGHPEANAMETALHMCPHQSGSTKCKDFDGDGATYDEANKITNVGELTFATLRDPVTGDPQKASEGVYFSAMVAPGTCVPKPKCPDYDGDGNRFEHAQVYTASAAVVDETGKPLRHFNTSASDATCTIGGSSKPGWTINMTTTVADAGSYRTKQAHSSSSIMVMTRCEP